MTYGEKKKQNLKNGYLLCFYDLKRNKNIRFFGVISKQ